MLKILAQLSKVNHLFSAPRFTELKSSGDVKGLYTYLSCTNLTCEKIMQEWYSPASSHLNGQVGYTGAGAYAAKTAIVTRLNVPGHGKSSGRFISPNGMLASDFKTAVSAENAADALQYGRVKNELYTVICGAFCECDGAGFNEQIARLQTFIEATRIPPFMVVYSGNKSLHVYFRFSRPVILHDAKEREAAAQLQQKLACIMRGDLCVCEARREMRAPNTLTFDRAQPVVYFDASARVPSDIFADAINELMESQGLDLGAILPRFNARKSLRGLCTALSHTEPTLASELRSQIEALPHESDFTPANDAALNEVKTRLPRRISGISTQKIDGIRLFDGANGREWALVDRETWEAWAKEGLTSGICPVCGYKSLYTRKTDTYGHAVCMHCYTHFKPAAESSLKIDTLCECEGVKYGEVSTYRLKAIPTPTKSRVQVVKVPCGCGKSEACRRLIQAARDMGKNVCVLVARRELAVQAAQMYGLVCYLDNQRRVKKSLSQAELGGIVCSVQSIEALAAFHGAYDLIVIDELSECLVSSVFTPTGSHAALATDIINGLQILLTGCIAANGRVIACDAHANAYDIEALATLTGESTEVCGVSEKVKPWAYRTVDEIAPHALPAHLLTALAHGEPCLIWAFTKAQCEGLHALVSAAGYRALIITGESQKVGNAGADDSGAWRGYDAVIYNGAVGCGVSYTGSHFKHAYAAIESGPQWGNYAAAYGHRIFIQALARGRGVRHLHITDFTGSKLATQSLTGSELVKSMYSRAAALAPFFGTSLDSTLTRLMQSVCASICEGVASEKSDAIHATLNTLTDVYGVQYTGRIEATNTAVKALFRALAALKRHRMGARRQALQNALTGQENGFKWGCELVRQWAPKLTDREYALNLRISRGRAGVDCISAGLQKAIAGGKGASVKAQAALICTLTGRTDAITEIERAEWMHDNTLAPSPASSRLLESTLAARLLRTIDPMGFESLRRELGDTSGEFIPSLTQDGLSKVATEYGITWAKSAYVVRDAVKWACGVYGVKVKARRKSIDGTQATVYRIDTRATLNALNEARSLAGEWAGERVIQSGCDIASVESVDLSAANDAIQTARADILAALPQLSPTPICAPHATTPPALPFIAPTAFARSVQKCGLCGCVEREGEKDCCACG